MDADFYDPQTNIEELSSIASKMISAALEARRALGPGVLESAHEPCLLYGMQKRGIDVESRIVLPLCYDGKIIGAGCRIDMMAERRVIVELKAVGKPMPVHEAQILSCLKLSGKQIGFC
jgi:GxxExxY protein